MATRIVTKYDEDGGMLFSFERLGSYDCRDRRVWEMMILLDDEELLILAEKITQKIKEHKLKKFHG